MRHLHAGRGLQSSRPPARFARELASSPGWSVPSAAGDDESGFVGEDHELGSVAGVELGEDPADVRLSSEEADVETVADLGVREALRDQSEHLVLALGELVERDCGTGWWRLGREAFDE